MSYVPFSVTLVRLALYPFTFSNGVTFPPCTLIAAPTGAIHKGGELFPNPEEIDGFRFAKLCERDSDALMRHTKDSLRPQTTSLSAMGTMLGNFLKVVFASIITVAHIPFSPRWFFNEIKAYLCTLL